jgi:hypothetical protein
MLTGREQPTSTTGFLIGDGTGIDSLFPVTSIDTLQLDVEDLLIFYHPRSTDQRGGRVCIAKDDLGEKEGRVL